MTFDPVCGMTVDPAKAAGQFGHRGTTYYFCGKGCLAKFAADPEKYLAGAREPMAHAPAVISIGGLKRSHQSPVASPSVPQPFHQPSAIIRQPSQGHHPLPEWTCPMDPEVVSDRPGACPKCGMALEPRVATLSDAPNPELVDMTRRFWIGRALGAP